MNPPRLVLSFSLPLCLAIAGCLAPAEESTTAALDSCGMHDGDAAACAGRTDCQWNAPNRTCGRLTADSCALFDRDVAGCSGASECIWYEDITQCRNRDTCRDYGREACAARADCSWSTTARWCETRPEPSEAVGTFYGYNALTREASMLMLTQPNQQGRGRFVLYFQGITHKGAAYHSGTALTLVASSPIVWTHSYTATVTNVPWLGTDVLGLTSATYGTAYFTRSAQLFCESVADCNGQAEAPQDAAWECTNLTCRPRGSFFPGEG